MKIDVFSLNTRKSKNLIRKRKFLKKKSLSNEEDFNLFL
jgi:hypothetical protein